MPESPLASTLIDLNPHTVVGLKGLFQGKSDVAEWTPAACIEEA